MPSCSSEKREQARPSHRMTGSSTSPPGPSHPHDAQNLHGRGDPLPALTQDDADEFRGDGEDAESNGHADHGRYLEDPLEGLLKAARLVLQQREGGEHDHGEGDGHLRRRNHRGQEGHLVEAQGLGPEHPPEQDAVKLRNGEADHGKAGYPLAECQQFAEGGRVEAERRPVRVQRVGEGNPEDVPGEAAPHERPDIPQHGGKDHGERELQDRGPALEFELLVEFKVSLEENDADVREAREQNREGDHPEDGGEFGHREEGRHGGRGQDKKHAQHEAPEQGDRPGGVQISLYVPLFPDESLLESRLGDAVQAGHDDHGHGDEPEIGREQESGEHDRPDEPERPGGEAKPQRPESAEENLPKII
jgi:hypothetical protein